MQQSGITRLDEKVYIEVEHYVLTIDSLPNESRDRDSVVLHACFQLLKDFVEQEMSPNSNIDWKSDEKYQHARAEINLLYGWWLSYSESDLPDDESYEIETKMLMRLIAVRWALWT